MELPYDIKLFDKYRSGNITEKELATLQSQFDSPAALAHEVQLQQAIEQGIQSAGNHHVVDKLVAEIEGELQVENDKKRLEEKPQKKADISNMIDDINDELEKEGYFKKIANRKRLVLWAKRVASVAALLLLIPIGFAIITSVNAPNINQKISAAQLVEQSYIDYKINDLQAKIDEGKVGYAGGITIPQLQSLKAALLDFQAANYAESSRKLDAFLLLHPQNETANFYRGLCALQAEKYEEAQQLFSKNIYNQFQENAAYFNALSLLRLQKDQQAAPLLHLVAKGDSPHAETARKLLEN